MKTIINKLVYMQPGTACRLIFRRSLSLLAGLLTLIAAMMPALPAAAALEIDYQDDSTVSHPYAVQQLENKNLLICRVGFLNPGVVEVTPAGVPVWSFPGVEAAGAQRLSNGNTLIVDSGAPGPPYTPRVLEVTPGGRVVWEYRLPSLSQAPRYAQRLANGNTLITLPFRLIEVSSSKKVVWSYGWGRPVAPGTPGFLANPVQAVRLSNGNVLIVDQGFTGGRVFEITPGKQVVWQLGDYQYNLVENSSGAAAAGVNQPVENSSKVSVAGAGPAAGAGIQAGGKNSPAAAARVVQLKRPTGAVRLADGNTLIADAGTATLLEVSPAGVPVRSISWANALAGLPVMNQWLAMPLDDKKVILPVTLTNSRSQVLVVAP